MTTDFVYAGASDPEAVHLDITPSDSLPDLSVVTAATLSVVLPSGADGGTSR